MVESHLDQVHRGATLLLEREAISREEVEAIFGRRPKIARFAPRDTA
jgi:ATP-dependent Zn protease